MADAESRIKLGKSLQLSGMTVLNSIPSTADRRQVDIKQLEVIEKLLRSATAAIGKGAQIEAEARAELNALVAKPPRRFEV
jgi:hypothetical protein